MQRNALVRDVVEILKAGVPILVYDFDGREEEVDMVFYAGRVSWKSIKILRREAGGLICYVTGKEEGEVLGLTFMSEELSSNPRYSRLVKIPRYGDKPAFSLWVNHVSTRTGISDEDRATTIAELHKVVKLLTEDPEGAREKFYSEFMAPGHVPILLSRGIERRRGHTELVTKLAEVSGLERSMVIAEMLGEGKSLSKSEAISYARSKDLLLLEGKDILGL